MTVKNESRSKSRKVHNEFKDLPIEAKITTLIELELMTLAEGLEKIGECAMSLGRQMFETVLQDQPRERERSQGS
jgi:hypothetical protein